MVIKMLEEDKTLGRLFSSGTGGAINLVIPKFFAMDLDLGPRTYVSIFLNRKTNTLEIKKYTPPKTNDGKVDYYVGDKKLRLRVKKVKEKKKN